MSSYILNQFHLDSEYKENFNLFPVQTQPSNIPIVIDLGSSAMRMNYATYPTPLLFSPNLYRLPEKINVPVDLVNAQNQEKYNFVKTPFLSSKKQPILFDIPPGTPIVTPFTTSTSIFTSLSRVESLVDFGLAQLNISHFSNSTSHPFAITCPIDYPYPSNLAEFFFELYSTPSLLLKSDSIVEFDSMHESYLGDSWNNCTVIKFGHSSTHIIAYIGSKPKLWSRLDFGSFDIINWLSTSVPSGYRNHGSKLRWFDYNSAAQIFHHKCYTSLDFEQEMESWKSDIYVAKSSIQIINPVALALDSSETVPPITLNTFTVPDTMNPLVEQKALETLIEMALFVSFQKTQLSGRQKKKRKSRIAISHSSNLLKNRSDIAVPSPLQIKIPAKLNYQSLIRSHQVGIDSDSITHDSSNSQSPTQSPTQSPSPKLSDRMRKSIHFVPVSDSPSYRPTPGSSRFAFRLAESRRIRELENSFDSFGSTDSDWSLYQKPVYDNRILLSFEWISALYPESHDFADFTKNNKKSNFDDIFENMLKKLPQDSEIDPSGLGVLVHLDSIFNVLETRMIQLASKLESQPLKSRKLYHILFVAKIWIEFGSFLGIDIHEPEPNPLAKNIRGYGPYPKLSDFSRKYADTSSVRISSGPFINNWVPFCSESSLFLGNHQILAPECYFKPLPILGINQQGLSETLSSLHNAHPKCLSSVFLCGGASQTKSLPQRICNEIVSIQSFTPTILSSRSPLTDPWKYLASLSIKQLKQPDIPIRNGHSITKRQWEETGSSIFLRNV